MSSRTSERRPSLVAQIPIVASGAFGALLLALGVRELIVSDIIWLFGTSLILIGGLAMLLAWRTWQGHRPSWAFLVVLWGVVAFCAFFTAPEVLSLEHLKQVTPEMELQLGREKAEARIDDENMGIRLTNFGVCSLFALPFAAVAIVLGRRGRELERRA